MAGYIFLGGLALGLGLSEVLDLDPNRLLKKFGYHVFETFRSNYSVFFENVNHPFQLLEQVDSHVHKEVLKLYPEAELPRFQSEIKSENEMMLNYMSSRKMSDLAIGLIKGAANHFKEDVDVVKIGEENNGQTVMLQIKKI